MNICTVCVYVFCVLYVLCTYVLLVCTVCMYVHIYTGCIHHVCMQLIDIKLCNLIIICIL